MEGKESRPFPNDYNGFVTLDLHLNETLLYAGPPSNEWTLVWQMVFLLSSSEPIILADNTSKLLGINLQEPQVHRCICGDWWRLMEIRWLKIRISIEAAQAECKNTIYNSFGN